MIRRAVCTGTAKWPSACAAISIRKRPAHNMMMCLQYPVPSFYGTTPQTNNGYPSLLSLMDAKEDTDNINATVGHDNDNARKLNAEEHEELKALKDERRKLHGERAKRAAKMKDFKRRSILAEELMRIFATNHDCFNATLQELNINKKWGSGSSGSDSGLYEYRQFYLDSLQSFGNDALADNPDNGTNLLVELDLTSDMSYAVLDQFHAILNKFIESGTVEDIREFSKKYRKMQNMREKMTELDTALERQQNKQEQGKLELKVENEILQSMKAKAAEDQIDQIASLNEKVRGVKDMLPLMKASGEDNYANELDKLEADIEAALFRVKGISGAKNSESDLTKQKKMVRQIKNMLSSVSNRICAIEEEIERFNWPMPMEDYENITENILLLVPSITPHLAKHINLRHDDFDRYRQLEAHTDLTSPHEWYPRARLDKRKIIFHAGPTNSGKTYTALQRLKAGKKGMYLAPLRLLAAETYENLTAEGVYINLLTGQEQRKVPFATHRSSTVELACLQEDYDVVVIDEIQMLGEEFRGFAWTRALLGVRSKEIHVCGGREAIDIVKKICKMSGDDFELNEYKRFTDLKVQPKSLAKSSTAKGSYANVEPGDCVVAFSRNDIFAIAREIEQSTQYKCCVIYGSLPPDVRAEQARRFNNPDSEYDILVASDAIGMGLNLSIKRIIFNSMFKNNGERIVQLDHSSVKQIAGRAGRRNSPYPHGEVTTRDPNDMAHLRKCMSTEIKPVEKAGILPTPAHIASFNQHLGDYDSSKKLELHQTLRKFSEMATLKGQFFLCRQQQLEVISRWLKDIDNMTPEQKFVLCMSPVQENCPKSRNVLMRYVDKFTNGKVPGLHRDMRPMPPKSFDHLSSLCKVHQQLDLFMWLQNKFPTNAVEVLRAAHLRDTTVSMINKALHDADKLSLNHDYISKDSRVRQEYENMKIK